MIFQVNSGEKNYYVDLERKTCTCCLFQKVGIPCCHALALARLKNISVSSLISSDYKVCQFTQAYAELIFPVPNQCDEEIPANVEGNQFLPPTNPPGPGRRRKRRIHSTGEFTVSNNLFTVDKCGILWISKYLTLYKVRL